MGTLECGQYGEAGRWIWPMPSVHCVGHEHGLRAHCTLIDGFRLYRLPWWRGPGKTSWPLEPLDLTGASSGLIKFHVERALTHIPPNRVPPALGGSAEAAAVDVQKWHALSQPGPQGNCWWRTRYGFTHRLTPEQACLPRCWCGRVGGELGG